MSETKERKWFMEPIILVVCVVIGGFFGMMAYPALFRSNPLVPRQVQVGEEREITTTKIEPMQVLVAPGGKQTPVHPSLEIKQNDSIRSYVNNTCYVNTNLWVTGKDGLSLEGDLQDVVPCDQTEAMKAEQVRRLEPKIRLINSKLGMNSE